jgi:DNA polymerase I-like protein with 3'-5' exonuclease and polymerase domains
MLAVLGRAIHPVTTRRGYGWLAERNVPVFELMHPAFALRNRFTREAFLQDLRWALKTAPPTLPPTKLEVEPVETAMMGMVCESECEAAGACSFDCETYGIMHHPEFRLLSVAVVPDGADKAFTWDERALADDVMRASLARLLMNPRVRKDGHFLRYDVHAVEQGLGIRVQGWGYDTRLARKLLDPEADGRLEAMEELVGMGGAKEESDEALVVLRARRPAPVAEGQEPLFGSAAPPASDDRMKYLFADLPPDVLRRRNATDAIATRRLSSLLVPQVDAEPWSRRIFHELLAPLNDAIAEMERNGIRVNVAALEAADSYFGACQSDILPRLRAYGDFDPDSPQQVSELLFGKLGLKPQRTTEAGHASTDRDALDSIAHDHPIVPDLIAYRWFAHMRNTYGCGEDGRGGLKAHVRPDGRVHPWYDPGATRVGRLNCTDPSLHTIPREESEDHRKEGKLIRDAFVADPGWKLLSADYSQVELRVLAYLSGDEEMIGVYKRGEDLHQRTAEGIARQAWGMRPEEVGKVQRDKAKIVNFALVYGKGDESLATDLGVSAGEARRIRDAIFGRFPRVAEYRDACLAHARRKGEVWTKFDGERGRRRSLWSIAAEEGEVRSRAEHGSLHTPVCGTAADLSLRSIVECVRWIRADAIPVRLVLSVHDALVFEVREDVLAEAGYQIKRIMEGWSLGDVPLVVALKAGDSWGSLAKVAA